MSCSSGMVAETPDLKRGSGNIRKLHVRRAFHDYGAPRFATPSPYNLGFTTHVSNVSRLAIRKLLRKRATVGSISTRVRLRIGLTIMSRTVSRSHLTYD